MLDEAIALSLNIAPENYQYGGEAHREFVRRRFVARRNPQRIGVIRTYGVTEPVHLVALPRFAAWAQSLGWQLPIELVEIIDADEPGAAIPTGMAGRRPKERLRVENAIRDAIKSGTHTRSTLLNAKQDALAKEFNTSRATLQRALKSGLSKCSKRPE